MIKPVGEIKREFVVGPAPGRSLLHGALDVDDQVTAVSFAFAGHGIIAKADDIGRPVLAEIFPVRLRDAFIVNKDRTNLAPDVRGGFFLKLSSEPVSQLLQSGLIYRMFCLLV